MLINQDLMLQLQLTKERKDHLKQMYTDLEHRLSQVEMRIVDMSKRWVIQ